MDKQSGNLVLAIVLFLIFLPPELFLLARFLSIKKYFLGGRLKIHGHRHWTGALKYLVIEGGNFSGDIVGIFNVYPDFIAKGNQVGVVFLKPEDLDIRTGNVCDQETIAILIRRKGYCVCPVNTAYNLAFKTLSFDPGGIYVVPALPVKNPDSEDFVYLGIVHSMGKNTLVPVSLPLEIMEGMIIVVCKDR